MGKMIMALKKLGNKLTGKTPASDNTVGVINEIADEYEAPDLTPYATKTYVDGLMSGALKRSIVETLPVEDIDTNTIYMVLDSEASQQGNVYNEYLYINNTWELIGTTAASVATLEVSDITALTNEQCEALNPGDTVIVDNRSIYIVTNKDDANLSLVYVDSLDIEEYFYSKNDDSWEYDDLSIRPLNDFNMLFLYGSDGDIEDENDIQKIRNGAFIMLDSKTILLSVNVADLPNDSSVYTYCSAVFNNEYKVCTITITSDTQASYTVTTETIGGSGSSIHYMHAYCYDGSYQPYEITFMCEDSGIESYQDLGEYLYTHGFTQGYISSTDYDCSILAVMPSSINNGQQITGIYATMTISCDEPVYEIYGQIVHVSSGELVSGSVLLTNDIELSYIGQN